MTLYAFDSYLKWQSLNDNKLEVAPPDQVADNWKWI